MRKYFVLIKIGILNTLAYRGPIIFWLLGNIASLVMMIAVWFSARGGLVMGGYTKNELITYYIVSMVLLWLIGWHPAEWVSEKIRSGEIIGDGLLKPFSFYWRAFLSDLGWHIVAVPVGFLAAILFCFLFRENFMFLVNLRNLFWIVLSCGLAAMITYTFGMCIACLAFWFTQTGMANEIYWASLGMFGGQLMPLSFFPETARQILNVLPFRYMFSFPLELYFGRLTTIEIIMGIFMQLIWMVLLATVYKFMWREGPKVYNAWGQ